MGGGKPAARQGDMTRKGLDIVQGSARGADRCANRCGLLGVSHKKGQSELWQPGEPATRCEGSAC